MALFIPVPTPRRGHGGLAQQPIKLPFADVVAFAGSRQQARAIENGHAAALVSDEPGPLQRARSVCDACTSHAQHHGEEFFVSRNCPNACGHRHQEPTATTLLQGVKDVAGSRLRDLI